MAEKERIRKLEKEIKEVQVIKTIMLNGLEVRTRRWTEFEEVKQRFEDIFVGFENRLAKIEANMEEERSKSKASKRIEKKPKEKPKKTHKKFLYLDLTQTQREFIYLDFTLKIKNRKRFAYLLCTFYAIVPYILQFFYRHTLSIYLSHAST